MLNIYHLCGCHLKEAPYMYINNDGNSSTKNTRHVDANVNTRKRNQYHQDSSIEVEDVTLNGHPMPQIN
jgi:hypothetical protein